MPLVAKSLTITHPLPWGLLLLWDDAWSSEAYTGFRLKRQPDDSKATYMFVYWPRPFLIKEWDFFFLFFLISCASLLRSGSHAGKTGRNRPTAQSATVHCDYWFPQGPSDSVWQLPLNSLPPPFYNPGSLSLSRCVCIFCFVLRQPAHGSQLLLPFPPLLGLFATQPTYGKICIWLIFPLIRSHTAWVWHRKTRHRTDFVQQRYCIPRSQWQLDLKMT